MQERLDTQAHVAVFADKLEAIRSELRAGEELRREIAQLKGHLESEKRAAEELSAIVKRQASRIDALNAAIALGEPHPPAPRSLPVL